MSGQENAKERETRLALESHLSGQEELLAYTQGRLTGLVARPFYFGLTAERLIMMPIKRGKPAGPVYSIRRENLKELKWISILSPRLRVRLPKDHFDIYFRGRNWRRRAKELAEYAKQTPSGSLPGAISSEAFDPFQQALDFHRLGFLASAQYALDTLLEHKPDLVMDPSVSPLKAELDETRIALRTGAAFLFGNVLVNISFFLFITILYGAEGSGEFFDRNLVTSIIFDIWIGSSLWRGQTQWRLWAILRAALGLLFFGIAVMATGGIIDLLTQLAFSGSVILVLTGQSKRNRTYAAIGIYVIGYLGLLILSLLIAFLLG